MIADDGSFVAFALAGGDPNWTPRAPQPFIKPKLPGARDIVAGQVYGYYHVIEFSKTHGKWLCMYDGKPVYKRSVQILCAP